MSSFVLRILFSGLMAFVPSEDGTEVTVLLLNVDHAYHTSDGAALPSHKPLILARGNCTGACSKRDAAIANFMFVDSSSSAAADALEAALDGGGAWILAGSDIEIRKGSANDPALPALSIRSGVRGTSIVPTTSTERGDFSWVANLKQLCANGCTLDPAILGSNPPAGLIAARFRLKTGNLFTYSVARIGGNVTPVNFKRLDGTGNASPYTQAVASWVGADIEVSGSSVEIAETSFGGGAGRTMRLEPDANGKVEVAVLNLPPFIPPASPDNEAPEAGKHFEAYYELLQNPPARETRLVPRAGAAGGASYPQVGWQYVHPQSVLWSDLLNALRLNHGRSMYDRVLCPPANIPLP